MTAATEPGPRILTLDVLRGVAVMGILAMNIIAFSMPFQAYLNPAAYGANTGADLWAWIISFIFVDGKMRALFSLLFGASMLLVIERAEAAGGNGGAVHVRRMLVLLLFGLAHFFLIWFGDILTAYAVIGLLAYLFTAKTPRQLFRWSIILLAISLIIYALFFASPLLLQAAASAPDASAETIEQWMTLKAELGNPGPEMIAADLATFRGDYLGIVAFTLAERWSLPLQGILMMGTETLALMLLGMWGLKTGFLTGQWAAARYARVAAICIGIAAAAYALLAYLMVSSGFEVATTLALHGFATAPFRPLMTIGYAALIVLIVRGGVGLLGGRIAAAGRAAFTNYLGTSIIATFIFYGWGLGLYGTLGRAESYLVVLGIWAVMLLWSKPWLERYRYGPLEWLWRSMSRGSLQPMRKLPPAAPAAP